MNKVIELLARFSLGIVDVVMRQTGHLRHYLAHKVMIYENRIK